jgi:hypothetical protein
MQPQRGAPERIQGISPPAGSVGRMVVIRGDMPTGEGEALESKAVRDCRGLLNRWRLRACVSNTLLSSARHGLRHASRFGAAELAGSVSEWLGAGLQNPLHWFESSRNLEICGDGRIGYAPPCQGGPCGFESRSSLN